MMSGLLVTHNCEEFDYCYRESLDSLMDVCDEVIVVDGSSTDGTRDVLSGYSGIKVFDAPWKPVPGTLGKWLSDLYNLAKSKARNTYQIGLQADEVLHEIDSSQLRKLRGNYTLKRLNFWRDSSHFLPHGRVCSDRVFRVGASSVKFVGDAEGMQGGTHRRDLDVCIFHYGFLRKTDSLIAKSISFEREVFGEHNKLFDQMQSEGRDPFDNLYNDLIPYSGTHPKYAHEWLTQRGYSI
jgi:glycosyltransferase involved in cell wall biosynthesis